MSWLATIDNAAKEFQPFFAGILCGVLLLFAAIVTAVWSSDWWRTQQQEDRINVRGLIRRERHKVAKWLRGLNDERIKFTFVHHDGRKESRSIDQLSGDAVIDYVIRQLEDDSQLPEVE